MKLFSERVRNYIVLLERTKFYFTDPRTQIWWQSSSQLQFDLHCHKLEKWLERLRWFMLKGHCHGHMKVFGEM